VPILDFPEDKKLLGSRNMPSLSNHEEARGAEAYRDGPGLLAKRREIPWLQIHSDIIETEERAVLPSFARFEIPEIDVSPSLHAFSTPSSNIHEEMSEWASRAFARFNGAALIVDLDFLTPSRSIQSLKSK
jgi:hypothetical protein